MRFQQSLLALFAVMVFLGGCSHDVEHVFDNPFASAPAPDYSIVVTRDAYGDPVAVPPDCPDWRTVSNSPLQNEPWPQFGCAHARNLAAMVEQPEDLMEGRELSPALGSKAADSMRHYNEEKTKALIDPNAKAPINITTDAMGQQSEGLGGLVK